MTDCLVMSITQPESMASSRTRPTDQIDSDVQAHSHLDVDREMDLAPVHDYANRMVFLTELDSQTWLARYSAAERLGDPGAVSSPAAYAAWLRRLGAAWSQVPMPTQEQAAQHWPTTTVAVTALDVIGQLDADLRDISLITGGGPHRDSRQMRTLATSMQAALEDVDAAYVVGAAYVAVVAAQEVAVLAADIDHLSTNACRTPLPQHYVVQSTQIAAARSQVRRDLSEWAAAAGPQAAERVVLAARMLTEHLAAALTEAEQAGW
jgi:hypothetical protein